MVKRFFARAKGRLTVGTAASLLAASTLVSSVLGLYREKLLLSYYLDTYAQGLDAYRVAFTIPDFMFFLLVSGALSVTLIPVLNERLVAGNTKSAWELCSSLINLFAIATFVTSVLIIIFAEPLVQYLVAPGLDESTRGLAVSLMRVIAINPFLFSISTVLASMQQAIGRFFFFALAPMTYSLGIIFGILVLTNKITIFGVTIFEGGIMGVALGVVVGSILQLIVSSIGMKGVNFEYQFKIFWQNLGFRQVLKLLPARSFDQGIDYFNNLVEMNLASRLRAGSISVYHAATTLHMVPINLIGVAISTAAFPKMTERLAQGRKDLFRKELQTVLRVIIWLALPITAISFLGRGYIVSFLKVGGSNEIAGILSVLAVAILFRSVYHIASRSFYAQQDTRTPLYISIGVILLNIALATYFVFQTNLGVFGLAAAQSIVSVIEVLILFSIMQRRIKNLFNAKFVHGVLRMISATGLMFVVTYIMIKIFNLTAFGESFFALLPPFTLIVVVSLGSYLLFSRLLGLEEAKPVLKKLKDFVFSRIKPVS
ncbi:MAG TPA: murein biosynthesis integral membrane protein MurJ [Magnetospirillaceae bacterium]|nr:murein biosynthesis integral membrane protein MurJ [Magnetospirillaceae bacterium]